MSKFYDNKCGNDKYIDNKIPNVFASSSQNVPKLIKVRFISFLFIFKAHLIDFRRQRLV